MSCSAPICLQADANFPHRQRASNTPKQVPTGDNCQPRHLRAEGTELKCLPGCVPDPELGWWLVLQRWL